MTATMNVRKEKQDQRMCPIVGAIQAVVTESRLLVVRHLSGGPKRFNELLRISGINSKTLSLTLKFLENNGIINREVISTRPFTVQYSLTPSGRELMPAEAIRLRQTDRIGELARRFVGFVKAGRDHLAARKARRVSVD